MVTSGTIEDDGLLLPSGTLLLLASSAEGSSALAHYGWAIPANFRNSVTQLERDLREDYDAEAHLKLEISQRIAAISRDAEGWLSVTCPTGEVVPAILLVGPDSVIVARLHGEVVEWLASDNSLAGRVVEASLAQVASGRLHVTALRASVVVCSATFGSDTVNVAGRDDAAISQLTAATANGVNGVVAAMMDLIKDSRQTKAP